jgi:sulfate transport system substrate-binding protein
MGAGLVLAFGCNKPSGNELLNVSYDPTREFYREFNEEFVKHWKTTTGEDVQVKPSHGGSGKQAGAVIEGLEADVVTLALAYDIDVIADKAKLLPENWQERLPLHSAPYTSTIVFLVRKGNPKGIKDWDDLVKKDVSVITPNPKTSGGARWNYLAAWAFSLKKDLGDLGKLKDPKEAEAVKKAQAKAQEFVAEMLRHAPILDTGARGSTMTFVKNGQGDVLLAWENEAILAMNETFAAGKKGTDQFEIVVPSISILAEPSVAVVDKNAAKHGTEKVAKAYLEFLYSKTGQTLAAKHHYRPHAGQDVDPELLKQFPKVELVTIDDVFGGWRKAQKEHFDNGGTFDQVYKKK